MTSLPKFSNIWQGYLTPPSHWSSQGICASHCGKEYRRNPVVREFLDVFLDDLLGMPSE
jgi:hypothetical protein